MAPEQSEGRPAGEQADLYSLALVLYEALPASTPSAAPTRPRPPAGSAARSSRWRSRRPDLPSPLTAAIDGALSTSPHGRCGLGSCAAALQDAHRSAASRRPAGPAGERAAVELPAAATPAAARGRRAPPTPSGPPPAEPWPAPEPADLRELRPGGRARGSDPRGAAPEAGIGGPDRCCAAGRRSPAAPGSRWCCSSRRAPGADAAQRLRAQRSGPLRAAVVRPGPGAGRGRAGRRLPGRRGPGLAPRRSGLFGALSDTGG